MKQPNDFFFDVQMSQDPDWLHAVGLSTDGVYIDDRLGSHNIGKAVKEAFEKAGINSEGELMEGMWEVKDSIQTKEQIIKNMTDQGFKYKEGLFEE